MIADPAGFTVYEMLQRGIIDIGCRKSDINFKEFKGEKQVARGVNRSKPVNNCKNNYRMPANRRWRFPKIMRLRAGGFPKNCSLNFLVFQPLRLFAL